MREKYQNDKYTKFLPRESQELHSTFIVDGKAFTFFQSMIKSLVVEIQKDKMISLCSKYVLLF